MLNTLKKKRRKRNNRELLVKEWISNFTGNNIVEKYAKRFHVSLPCAANELRFNGITISKQEEVAMIQSILDKKRAIKIHKKNRKLEKQERKQQDKFSSDTDFAFIAGYTSGGAAFGIGHDEMKDFLEIEDDMFAADLKLKDPNQLEMKFK